MKLRQPQVVAVEAHAHAGQNASLLAGPQRRHRSLRGELLGSLEAFCELRRCLVGVRPKVADSCVLGQSGEQAVGRAPAVILLGLRGGKPDGQRHQDGQSQPPGVS